MDFDIFCRYIYISLRDIQENLLSNWVTYRSAIIIIEQFLGRASNWCFMHIF